MRIKFVLFLLMATSLTACLDKPVLYREDHIPVNKENIEDICTTLTSTFPQYSCTAYFNKTYQTKDSLEIVKIKLQQDRLNLTYKTSDRYNGPLFKRYDKLVKTLKK